MSIYVNRLPIEFGKEGVVLYDLGYEGVGAAHGNSYSQPFESGGVWYAWPTNEWDPKRKSARLDPATISDQVQEMLLDRLRGLLADLGVAILNGGSLEFVHEHGSRRLASSLEIEFDRNNRDFHVLIKGAQQERLDELSAARAVVDRLRGKQLTQHVRLGNALETPEADTISLPSLIFSPDGTQTNQLAKQGLKRFGPFSRERFRNRRLRLLIINRQKQKGAMSKFVNDLLHGIKSPNELAEIWGPAWKDSFGISALEPSLLDVNDYEAGQIQKVSEVMQVSLSAGNPYDIVVYESAQAEPQLEACLMRHGIPSHWIDTAKLGGTGVDHANYVRNAALVLYAKVGGEPWILPKDPTMEQEFVIGLGSVASGHGIAGFATVFSSHGNYKLGYANWVATLEESNRQIVAYILAQLEQIGKVDGWADRSRLNILFHLDRSVPNTTISVLKEELMKHLGSTYELQIAFLHFEYNHPYRMWNTNQQGLDHQGRTVGRYMPKTGTTLVLSEDKALLQVAEPNQVILRPDPLLITRLPNSDEWGLQYMVTQAYYFCGLSWRSVDRALLPATLEYGQLIAQKFELLHAADPSIQIHSNLYNIPWYL